MDQEGLNAPAVNVKALSRRTLLRSLMAGAITQTLPFASAQGATGNRRSHGVNESPAPLLDPANGPIVILIHGALAEMGFWKLVIPALNEYCAVISYTLYGHHSFHNGRNLTPHTLRGHSYTLQRHANDLLELIDQVGAGPAHLVGHDIGSNIALRAAMMRPELVASLTLCETCPIGLTSDDTAVRDAADQHRAILLQVQRAWSAGESNRALDLFLQNYVAHNGMQTPDWVRAMFAQNLATLPMLVDLHADSSVLRDADFQHVSMPMNLLSSVSTRPGARAGNSVLANRFQQATHSLIAGGYLAPIIAPQPFSHALQTFMNPAGASATLLRT